MDLRGSPMHDAALKGDCEQLIVLATHHDVNDQDNINQVSPLHFAVMGGHVEAARTLISLGAELERVERNGRTALLYCVRYVVDEDARMLEMLLDKGAKATSKATYGESALHLAARFGNWQAAALLLSRGVVGEVNWVNSFGETALHSAARAKDEKMCSLLISYGANCELSSREGLSPYLLWSVPLLQCRRRKPSHLTVSNEDLGDVLRQVSSRLVLSEAESNQVWEELRASAIHLDSGIDLNEVLSAPADTSEVQVDRPEALEDNFDVAVGLALFQPYVETFLNKPHVHFVDRDGGRLLSVLVKTGESLMRSELGYHKMDLRFEAYEDRRKRLKQLFGGSWEEFSNTREISLGLVALDAKVGRQRKVAMGLVLSFPRQREEDMFKNTSTSAFEAFLGHLGHLVEMSSWSGFSGGLHEGMGLYTSEYNVQFIGHTCTLMNDEQRRRLLGNDKIMLYFLDGTRSNSSSGEECKFIPQFRGKVNAYAIVVKRMGKNLYSLASYRRKGMSIAAPLPPLEPVNAETMRCWVLAKVITATQVAYDHLYAKRMKEIWARSIAEFVETHLPRGKRSAKRSIFKRL